VVAAAQGVDPRGAAPSRHTRAPGSSTASGVSRQARAVGQTRRNGCVGGSADEPRCPKPTDSNTRAERRRYSRLSLRNARTRA
jgi:hypothetical protein